MPRKRVSVQDFAAIVMSAAGTLELDRAQFTKIASENNVMIPFRFDLTTKVPGKKGLYRVPVEGNVLQRPKDVPTVSVQPTMRQALAEAESNIREFPKKMEENLQFIPHHMEGFVEWGNFFDLYSIIQRGLFYPIYITGLSGNGKTLNVEEACYKAKREFIRANITSETDEDDLLGGYRLIEGDTVWQDGPVVLAMQRGAVLLLDEVDLASTKIMALQPVLEGKGVFLKKVSRWVRPIKGFNVIATANTKGKGSDTGHFVGTTVLNEAFLDRFAATMHQGYPEANIEQKILYEAFVQAWPDSEPYEDKTIDVAKVLIKNLVSWAEAIRQTFEVGGIQEVISTRRLVNIINAFVIFKDEQKAIEISIERFDNSTKSAMLELYKMQKKK